MIARWVCALVSLQRRTTRMTPIVPYANRTTSLIEGEKNSSRRGTTNPGSENGGVAGLNSIPTTPPRMRRDSPINRPRGAGCTRSSLGFRMRMPTIKKRRMSVTSTSPNLTGAPAKNAAATMHTCSARALSARSRTTTAGIAAASASAISLDRCSADDVATSAAAPTTQK